MKGRKEEISYYDLGGREAEMYRAIDEFLALSKRFSPEVVKRKKMIGGTVCSVLALVTLLIILLVKGALPLIIYTLVLAGVAMYFFFTYGTEPFPELERANIIIRKDGLEKVYNDLVHAKHISFTQIYIGDEYIFKRDNLMFRIKDIRKMYIRDVSDDDSTTYYASAYLHDELGILCADLKILKGWTDIERQRMFEELVRPIEEKRDRLKKLEDKL
jgi:hypothetical protein